MCRTSEVPREGEVKGVNENSLQRVILSQTLSLKQQVRRHSDTQISQRCGGGGEEQRKENRWSPNLRKWALGTTQVIEPEIRGTNAHFECTGWTYNSTPRWWTPAVVKLCRGKKRVALPHGVSPPAVLTNQMTPMTYASRFTAINHRISTFSQLDRQMTDEGWTDGIRGDSRPS